MLFNSQIFIFIFLPLMLIGWYIINHFKLYNVALVFLIGMSLWFYGYFTPSYLLILISSIAVNYFASFLMERFKKIAKPVFIVGLLLNIGLLGYFKYYDFFVENINFVFRSNFNLKHILLPLGISFFTLQQISFLIDRYWETAPHYGFLEYAAYVSFFPQLIAGPIVMHSELIPQFRNRELRKFNIENFRNGLTLFILGLAKKVLIADTFALIVDYGYAKLNNTDMPTAWVIALAYYIQLYFDFSGYCDMACGLGRMFNFELPINFNSPFKSLTVAEYWQRWHITLNRFFTSYVYSPMAMRHMRMKRSKKLLPMITIIVFLISGFWHGANWTFVIWGLLQGIGVAVSQSKLWKFRKKHKKLSWIITFFYFVIAQTVFRSENLTIMVIMLKKLFCFNYKGYLIEIPGALNSNLLIKKIMEMFYPHLSWYAYSIVYTLLMLILFVVAFLILSGRNAQEMANDKKTNGYSVGFTLGLSILFTWILVSLSQVSTFIYFNF